MPYDSKIPTGKGPDFTVYTQNPDPIDEIKKAGGAISENRRMEVNGRWSRVLFCSCFGGKFVSCTVRSVGDSPQGDPKRQLGDAEELSSPWDGRQETSDTENWLTKVHQTAAALYSEIFDQKDGLPQGLLVITGSTGAGKSKIARCVIHKYLERLVKKSRDRSPHLVTIEEPIEEGLYDEPCQDSHPKGLQELIDYTPRELKVDVRGLDDALDDALRQTPSVVFVGETRDRKDWPKLIQFAGTGHLVVTTAHAGSLTESLGHLLNNYNATTPALRSVVASRVLAVVHLRRLGLSGDKKDKKVTMPALWKGTLQSRMSLVSDGLSSVLPYRRKGNGIMGRAYFAETGKSIFGSLADDVLNSALRADLEER